MPKKKQEEFCRDEFESWLKSQYQNNSISWTDGDEPPDFWLNFNQHKYAVEVTRVLDEKDRTITASLWRIVDDAEKIAQKDNILFGTYIVSFCNAITISRKWKEKLKLNILDFIKRTNSVKTHVKENIIIKGQHICYIHKLNPNGSVIGCSGPDRGSGWENDILCDLRDILIKTFYKKSIKLRKIFCPKILILYDLFGFAKRNLFIECVHSINQVHQFHTVYVVQDKNMGYVAYRGRPFYDNTA